MSLENLKELLECPLLPPPPHTHTHRGVEIAQYCGDGGRLLMCGAEKQVDEVSLLDLVHGVSWVQVVKKVHITYTVFSSQRKL